MTDFCEFTLPGGSCRELVDYVQDIVQSAKLLPTVRYGTGPSDATSAELTALWGPCDPPACALAVWFNSTAETYEVWSYISSTWRQTGSTGINSPYYTGFDGQGGLVGEGWIGNWHIDGNGNVHPQLTFGDEVLLNEDMEDWTLATIPDNWSNSLGTIAEENTIVHTGSSSASVTLNGSAALYQDVTVTEARWFQLSVYTYAAFIGEILQPELIGFTSGLTNVTISSKAYEWERLELTNYSLTTSGRVYITATTGSSKVFYVDTASIREITDGFQLVREFNGAYGTFYVDFTLSAYTHFGILLNYQDEDNYAMVIANRTTLYLVEVSAGAAATTASWAYTYSAGARLEVYRDSSDQVTIDYNGANIVTNQALSSPIASTVFGIIGTSEYSFASAFGYTPE